MSPCYLAEWYRPEFYDEPLEDTAAKLTNCAALISAAGTPIHLLHIVAVPTDEVVFAVFTAGSVNLVAQTCDRAGVPAQRLTAAINAHIAEAHS